MWFECHAVNRVNKTIAEKSTIPQQRRDKPPHGWIPLFSEDALVFPCMMVARSLAMKRVGWPALPSELAKDGELGAQLVFDFGLSLSEVWTRNARSIERAVEKEWTVRQLELCDRGGHTNATAALREWLHAKAQRSAEVEKLNTARRADETPERVVGWTTQDHLLRGTPLGLGYDAAIATPEYKAILSAEEGLYAAERAEQVAFREFVASCNVLLIRMLRREKKDFLRGPGAFALHAGNFFRTSPEEIRNFSVYASALGRENMTWLSQMCEALSRHGGRERMSLPSFGFRRSVGILQSYVDEEKEKDPSCPVKTIFADWIMDVGCFRGISPSSDLKNLGDACRYQDKWLDDCFHRFGFQTFSLFRKQRLKTGHDRLCRLLGLAGPGST